MLALLESPLFAPLLDALAVRGALGTAELSSVALLLGLRLLPLVLMSTLFTSLRGPSLLGMSMVQAVALFAFLMGLLPSALASHVALPSDAFSLLTLGLRELVLGASFAVVASVPLLALQQLGPSVEAVLVMPRTSLRDAVALFASALFVTTGGLRVVVAAFAHSLARAPIGQSLAEESVRVTLESTAHLLTSVLALGVAFASPVLVSVVVVQVGLGLSARAASGLDLSFAERPLRMVMVIVALMASLAWISTALNAAMIAALSP